MQCPACAFENMPGVEACARCGAVFSVERAQPADLRPPRSGRRRRPGFRFALNRLRDSFPETRPTWMQFSGSDAALPARSVALMFYSLVPGLGHAMTIDACARLVGHQQVVRRRTVGNVAMAAVFDDGRVFEHVWAALGLMASRALLRLEIQTRPSSLVRTMTIDAPEHAFRDGMMRG